MKADSSHFQQKDFLLTTTGSLLVNAKLHEHHFVKGLQTLFTKKYANLKFNLNLENKEKLFSFLENNSLEKNHHSRAIWELINFKDENQSRGVRIHQGDVFRIGRQIVKLKYLKNDGGKKRRSLVPEYDQMNNFYSLRNVD